MTLATNASIMRASNRKLILNLIRRSPISRVEIAEKVHLTRASITQIVDELIEAGLVEEMSTAEHSGLGRKRIQLAIRSDARYVFGVNIRRRRCHVGVINLGGDTLAHTELSLEGKTVSEACDEIGDTLLRIRRKFSLPNDRILGIGVSSPGPVDYLGGVILNPPNFPTWHDVPVRTMLEERTGYTTLLEKDTNARALEEKYYGAAASLSNFMLIQIDDGVGSGVMIHDKIYRGMSGMGSEIGHTSIRFDGPVCSCGNRGCLENYLRVPALLENTSFSCWEELAANAESTEAAAVLDRCTEYLSAALVNAINLFDLEKVILTGEVSLSPEPLLKRLNPMLSNRILSKISADDVPVIASRAAAPVRTAAMALLHEMFQSRT